MADGDALGVLEPLRQLRMEWAEPALAAMMAEALSSLGRCEEAIACLQEDITQGVANHWTYYHLGHHLATLWRIEEAAAAFRCCHAMQGWSASQERGYVLSHDYISGHIANWQYWFSKVITTAPIRILEIGSWEGGSTLWLLDHVVGPRGGSLTSIDPWENSPEDMHLQPLGQTAEGLFDANVARTGLGQYVSKVRGRSQDALPMLEPESFDLIYIDGVQEAQGVIQDAIHAHRLLDQGGYLLFDARTQHGTDAAQNKLEAINFFCRTFNTDYRTLHRGEQVLLQRQGVHKLPDRLLLILGMHRSGTSALSGALCQQGLCGPQQAVPASPSNPTGHWEPSPIVALHEELLRTAGSSWDDPMAMTALELSSDQTEHKQKLQEALQASFPQWRPGQVAVVKDPRQCRLQPLWNGLIEQQQLQVAVILMVRHPLAVAQSLQRRDQLPLERSLLLWLEHTLEAEKHTREQRRCVVAYEQLLRNPEETLEGCVRLVGLEEQIKFEGETWIQPDLNHEAPAQDKTNGDPNESGGLLELALEVYQRLEAIHGSWPDHNLQQQLDLAHAQWRQHVERLSNQSSRHEMVQLFWEPAWGGGFSEDHAVRASVAVTRGLAAVTLPLSEAATAPLALRLDPSEQPGLIQLKHVALLGAGGQVLWEGQHNALTPANPQTAILENGDIVAGDADPSLLLAVPATVLQQLNENCSLKLEARWQPLNSTLAQQLLAISKSPAMERVGTTQHPDE